MENEFVRWLRERLPPHPQLRLGVGDDAALLRLTARHDVVVTTDLVTDGVHFVLADTEPKRIGRKALAVNLSDMAAMAARPLAAVVSMLLPRDDAMRLAEQLIEGMLPLADKYKCAIAGGDTNTWDGPLVVSVTALGEVDPQKVWRRDGAQPGDRILVTGSLGGSQSGRHLDFEPRINEAITLADKTTVHAAMDLSDGLATDLPRMAAASGCGVEIQLDALPLSSDVQPRKDDSADAVRHALCDGEDFELLLAVAPEDAASLLGQQPLDVPITEIGRCIEQPGVWKVTGQGDRQPLDEHGFEHRAT